MIRRFYFIFAVIFSSFSFAASNHLAQQCKKLCDLYEDKYNFPKGILNAIACLESRHNPYAINYKGKSYFFKTKEDALKFLKKIQAQGRYNISLGCMQINFPVHKREFKKEDTVFDPHENIAFAARLLNQLRKQNGGCIERAVACYNSCHKEVGERYRKKVYKKWPQFKEVTNAIHAKNKTSNPRSVIKQKEI